MLTRSAILIYAAVAYLIAMANIAYIVGFLQNFLVPKGINDGVPGALWPSIAINLLLIWGFGIHHSVTARASFKRIWTRIIPPSIERATYLYMTAGMTWLLVAFWQPIPVTIWNVEMSVLYWSLIAVYLAVWGLMFSSTFPIGHFSFFGLAQAWRKVRGQAERPASFTARWAYAVIRHPISLGWMLTPWLTPHMTIGQLCFALGATSYVLIATIYEERDLTRELGETYRNYRNRVPAFLPWARKHTQREESPAE